MNDLFYKNSKFIYQGKTGEQTLLDCSVSACLNNKSQIAMHRLSGQSHNTIPDFLIKLIELERNSGNNLDLPFGIIDILLTRQLIKTSQPIRMLEYGSGQGTLSWHLAELLGTFHKESILVCGHDTINLEWMECISRVKQPPKLSFFAGDFGDFQLQQNFFNIILINGTVNFTEPYQVILDVLRLAKENALIFCYTNNTPFLESIFQLFFEQRKEYEITPSSKVIMANIENNCWNIHKDIDFRSQALHHIEQTKLIYSKKESKNISFFMINTLKQDIKSAAEIGDIELKLQLLEQKELLIQYILSQ